MFPLVIKVSIRLICVIFLKSLFCRLNNFFEMKIGLKEKIFIGLAMKSKTMKSLLANWKTTLSGLAMLTGGLAAGFTVLSNGWESGDFELLTTAFVAITGGFGLIAGRDAGVSSESSGAK